MPLALAFSATGRSRSLRTLLAFDDPWEAGFFVRSCEKAGRFCRRWDGLRVVVEADLSGGHAFLAQRLRHLCGLFTPAWPQAVDRADAPVSLAPPVVVDQTRSVIDLPEVSRRMLTDRRGRRSDGGNGGAGTTIAVLDTGLEPRPEYQIAGRVSFVPGESEDDLHEIRHGSNVAMCAASLAPKARFHGVKVLSAAGWGELEWVIAGLNHVVERGIPVANLSLGAHSCSGRSTCVLCRAVEEVERRGTVVVAAAGNSGPSRGSIECPGGSRGAVAVGAITAERTITDFSSWGSLDPTNPNPQVVAYGDSILLRNGRGQAVPMSGTSFASPLVAGCAAVIKAALGAKANPTRIREILMGSASRDDLDQSHRDPERAGAGLVNLAEAVRLCAKERRNWSLRLPTLSRVVGTGVALAGCLTLMFGLDHVAMLDPNRSRVRLMGSIREGPDGSVMLDDGTGAIRLWTGLQAAPPAGCVALVWGTFDPSGGVLADSRIILTTREP